MCGNRMIFIGIVVLVSVAFAGCNRPASPANSKPAEKPTPTPRPSPRTSLEANLNYLDRNFAKVLVFSRLDGGAFLPDDIKFLKENAPVQTNQWLKTDDSKQVVAGTNFPFKPEQLEALGKRFKIDDESAEYGRKQ